MNRWPIAPVTLAVWTVALCVPLSGPVPPSLARDTQATAATAVPEPPPGAAVFEMKYRGLSAPDDPLSYRSYWGFGTPGDGSDQKDPFVLAVKSRVKECSIIYNPYLPKAPYSVVELKDNKPVAYYFDLNADGTLSDDEKFPPAATLGSNFGYPYAFITSDFLIPTKNQQEIPFRVMVVGYPMGPDRISYMCSPCCVLEGQGTLAGEPMKLVLYADGFKGSFTEFGRCSIALVPAHEKLGAYVSRSMLSSLTYYQGAFYRLKLQGTHAKTGTVRVVLEKDTTPTGQAAINVAGVEGMKARPAGMQLQGAKDATIQFSIPQTQPTLPIGSYKLSRGSLSYGLARDDEWNVSFEEGPPFDIKAAETVQVDLGKPVLTVSAIDEKDRYANNARERSTYAKGTSIYLTPQIKGKAGEVYTRFSQKAAGSNPPTDVKPHLAILDSNGKTVASADMEYG